jgi:3-oxoacyl-[acyl-carrier-protein] synthase-3
MAVSKISGVRITGIACAVPEKRQTLMDDVLEFSREEIEKISKNTGVMHRHISPEGMCTSDLCHAASEKLFEELDIDRESIDALIFVSQTPDYFLPATSCVLQFRLNLTTDCAAFDVNLGCSGYPYGIWLASNLIFSGSAKKVLLLAGDTCNYKVSNLDRGSALLFGDAGTATILESCDKAEQMTFVLGTDGSGCNNLIIPAGSFRNPSTEVTRTSNERENGNIRSDENLYMNGAEIFTFTLRVVAPMVKTLLKESGSAIEDIDYFVMHQANSFILKHLTKKLKLPSEKVPIAMENFGNTSSASIPMTLKDALSTMLKNEDLRLVLAGFGVGYSWAAVELQLNKIVMPDLVLVN